MPRKIRLFLIHAVTGSMMIIMGLAPFTIHGLAFNDNSLKIATAQTGRLVAEDAIYDPQQYNNQDLTSPDPSFNNNIGQSSGDFNNNVRPTNGDVLNNAPSNTYRGNEQNPNDPTANTATPGGGANGATIGGGANGAGIGGGANGATIGGGANGAGIVSPLRFSGVCSLLTTLVNLATEVGAILGVLFLIWSGFIFVTARGNPGKLKLAKNTLYSTLIGISMLLGATLIAKIIIGTIAAVIGPSAATCGS